MSLAPTPGRPPIGARLWGFFGRHPVVLLALLTPGIPEYLSGSSSVGAIVLNPILFVFQVGANVGLYTTGALLIREAIVRRRLAWPSLALFGAAYALLEEGVALSTFFDPSSRVVGSLGSYGHFLGVNWVWATGLVMFHTVYSIALPLVLLALALPETRGRSLLSDRALGLTVFLLAVDVIALILVTSLIAHFVIPLPILVGSLLTIAVLTVVGLLLPAASAPRARAPPSPTWMAVLGAVLFPVTLLIESFLQALRVPAAVAVALLAGVYLAWGARVAPTLVHVPSARTRIALASGLLLPVAVLGVLVSITFPLVLLVDLGLFLLLRRLWRQHPPEPGGPPAGGTPMAGVS